MKYSKYDVVIIGSGLAGLYLANKLAKQSIFQNGILLITKESLYSGSTSLAQGGIVSVIPELNPSDSIELHVKDTISAGCGLNNINTVKFVSENSSIVTQELIAMGVDFDRNSKNMLNFTMEGAHSTPRILHCDGDATGSVIEEVLCKDISDCGNVDIYANTMAVQILTDSCNCAHGLIAYNHINNTYEAIYSNNIVLATGGIGQLYKNTTNPIVSTADGIALALNAGAEVSNMEFVQFHPTGLYCKNKEVTPLISESVRGEGAKLVNIKGEYFASKYHKMAELAPRDIVARAIINEMKETNCEYVNLDISQIGIEKFKMRFPTITKLCEENNIDISNGLIPVAPVQHYFMGGIKTNLNSMTTVNNLYAIGECAMTGLHGANRLASNSLLECGVFASNLSDYIINNFVSPSEKSDEKIKTTVERYSSVDTFFNDSDLICELFDNLKSIMSEHAGIVRTNEGLQKALVAIFDIESAIDTNIQTMHRKKFELLNAIAVSKQIVQSAINRRDSVGAHFRSDCQTDVKEEYIGNKNYDELLAR